MLMMTLRRNQIQGLEAQLDSNRAEVLHAHPTEETDSVYSVEQLLRRNVKRFRGGLVFKAHRLLRLTDF